MEDKKQGKVIDKILSFPSVVGDYDYWFNQLSKREGNIVGDGRVYAWLDEDDVLDTCKKSNLSAREIVAVRGEFNAERLNSIWNHCCDMESDHYVDWRGGCSFNDYTQRSYKYGKYLLFQKGECNYISDEEKTKNITEVWPDMKYHIKEFQEYEKKGWDSQKLLKHYRKVHKEDMHHLDLLKFLGCDGKEIWGGKYPVITKTDYIAFHEESEIEDLVYHIEQASKKLNNKTFYEELCGKEQRYNNYDSVREVLEVIDYFVERTETAEEAVAFVESYIDDVKRDWKQILLGELEHEIGEFVSDSFNLEDRIQDNSAKFDTLVTVKSDEVITNKGAHVPLVSVKSIIDEHHKGVNVVGKMVGKYQINQVLVINNESYFKIGCHLFRLSEVEEKLKTEFAQP